MYLKFQKLDREQTRQDKKSYGQMGEKSVIIDTKYEGEKGFHRQKYFLCPQYEKNGLHKCRLKAHICVMEKGGKYGSADSQ